MEQLGGTFRPHCVTPGEDGVPRVVPSGVAVPPAVPSDGVVVPPPDGVVGGVVAGDDGTCLAQNPRRVVPGDDGTRHLNETAVSSTLPGEGVVLAEAGSSTNTKTPASASSNGTAGSPLQPATALLAGAGTASAVAGAPAPQEPHPSPVPSSIPGAIADPAESNNIPGAIADPPPMLSRIDSVGSGLGASAALPGSAALAPKPLMSTAAPGVDDRLSSNECREDDAVCAYLSHQPTVSSQASTLLGTLDDEDDEEPPGPLELEFPR